ncbi:Uncharacterised protein [Zhongshania aliphaticivorans]|uniref:VWA domain-containing protein n=1 Tax=Zhongshania aliphaticivorans TaxID=1470434 RepID=A0A5S9Q651_9GAMM|nr:VWA domain-containing protein [Zhongshania aliphaticivorans]CAA0103733.1 Uncharacterised protein [Zhongshania aliphaticivorans]CAA0113297.1 Uncharacterised protein [Zhongshania aliphaticivorans]
MDDTLLQFIRHLRHHGVAISPAETLDAMRVVSTVGYSDPKLLHDGLASCLAKTVDEHSQFSECFDLFFFGHSNIHSADNHSDNQTSPKNSAQPSTQNGNETAENASNNEDTASAQGDAQGQGEEGGQGVGGSGAGQQKNDVLNEVIRAAAEAGLDNIQYRTQRGVYRRKILNALKDDTTLKEIQRLQDAGDDHKAQVLSQLREHQISAIKELIDRQLLLNNDSAIKQLRDATLQDTSLSAMEHYHRERLPPLIRKLAKKLAARHSQRHKRSRQGKLDLGKTLRRNMAYGGIPFHRFWKSTHKDKSDIFILCDISGSVSAWSRVLLLFVQALSDVLPSTRCFVFCGKSIEVSDLFKAYPADEAMAIIQDKHGLGSSDYGQALTTFWEQIESKLTRRSCVIILGDGRGNGGDTGIDALRKIYHRAKLVLWFNPESHHSWNTGDSEIRRYQSASHYVAECGSLRKLERLLDQLLTLIR